MFLYLLFFFGGGGIEKYCILKITSLRSCKNYYFSQWQGVQKEVETEQKGNETGKCLSFQYEGKFDVCSKLYQTLNLVIGLQDCKQTPHIQQDITENTEKKSNAANKKRLENQKNNPLDIWPFQFDTSSLVLELAGPIIDQRK